MMSLSDDNQADTIDAFTTTSRYLDGILNINTINFDNMVSQIYPAELQLYKTNTFDTEYVLKRVSFGSKYCTKELKPPFWTCICSFLMILLLLKFVCVSTTAECRAKIWYQ